MLRYFRDIREVLPKIFESDLNGARGMKTHNSDRIVGIVGAEGSGKSTLELIYTEEWYKHQGIPVTEEHINQICSNEEDFANALKTVKKYDLIGLDEAVLSSYSRTSISQGNIVTNKFLMTCRGLNLKILVLIPNILDLDSYIRSKRLTSCYFVLPNYKVAYFSRKKLRTLLPKLQEMAKQGKYPDPMKCGVFPNFVAKFHNYDGVLAKPYHDKKQAGMEKVRQMLLESLEGKQTGQNSASMINNNSSQKEVSPLNMKIVYALQRGMTKTQIKKWLGCSLTTIDNTIEKHMPKFNYKKTRVDSWGYQDTLQVEKEIKMGAHLQVGKVSVPIVENSFNFAQVGGQTLNGTSKENGVK